MFRPCFPPPNATSVVAALLIAATAACSSTGTEPDSGDDLGPDCVADPSACGPSPAQAELESAYVDSINVILAEVGDFAAALEWVRAQDQVVEADADAHALFFRLDGGEPLFMLDIDHDPARAAAPAAVGAPGQRTRPPGVWGPSKAVVGRDTPRDDPLNRKQALFLEPFHWELGDRFQEHMDELRKIPDYAWGEEAIWHRTNGDADPSVFGLFDTFDAVFVSTHGAQFKNGHTFISTGIVKEFGAGQFDEVCEEIGAVYEGTPGARCGVIEGDGTNYVTVGLQTPFFQDAYGSKGGLERAVVYMGGCNTSRDDNWYLADALAGANSAYYGWTNTVYSHKHPDAIDALLFMLIVRRSTTQNALDVACLANKCGGPDWGSAGSHLRLYPNGEESKNLRLYDPPTLKDPRSPTSILGLAPGDTLLIEGIAGDDVPDRLRLMVDITGVIDPEDKSDPPVGAPTGGGVARSLAELNPDAADKYTLHFMVEGQDVGADNLGEPMADAVEVSQLDDVTWRYAYTADLPFDVQEGQTVTLKVEVPLPEGGVGDYEVDVVLKEPVCEYRFTLGNQVVKAEVGDRMVFNTEEGRLWQVGATRPSESWNLTMLPPDAEPSSRPDAPGTWPMVIQGDMGLTDPNDLIYATDPPPAATLVLDTLAPHRRVQGTVSGPVNVLSTTNPRTLHAEWFFSIRYEPGQFTCTVGGGQ